MQHRFPVGTKERTASGWAREMRTSLAGDSGPGGHSAGRCLHVGAGWRACCGGPCAEALGAPVAALHGGRGDLRAAQAQRWSSCRRPSAPKTPSRSSLHQATMPRARPAFALLRTPPPRQSFSRAPFASAQRRSPAADDVGCPLRRTTRAFTHGANRVRWPGPAPTPGQSASWILRPRPQRTRRLATDQGERKVERRRGAGPPPLEPCCIGSRFLVGRVPSVSWVDDEPGCRKGRLFRPPSPIFSSPRVVRASQIRISGVPVKPRANSRPHRICHALACPPACCPQHAHAGTLGTCQLPPGAWVR